MKFPVGSIIPLVPSRRHCNAGFLQIKIIPVCVQIIITIIMFVYVISPETGIPVASLSSRFEEPKSFSYISLLAALKTSSVAHSNSLRNTALSFRRSPKLLNPPTAAGINEIVRWIGLPGIEGESPLLVPWRIDYLNDDIIVEGAPSRLVAEEVAARIRKDGKHAYSWARDVCEQYRILSPRRDGTPLSNPRRDHERIVELVSLATDSNPIAAYGDTVDGRTYFHFFEAQYSGSAASASASAPAPASASASATGTSASSSTALAAEDMRRSGSSSGSGSDSGSGNSIPPQHAKSQLSQQEYAQRMRPSQKSSLKLVPTRNIPHSTQGRLEYFAEVHRTLHRQETETRS